MICTLTEKQLNDLKLIASGKTYAQAGDITGRSERAVTRSIEEARKKAGAKTTAHLVALAMLYRWVKDRDVMRVGAVLAIIASVYSCMDLDIEFSRVSRTTAGCYRARGRELDPLNSDRFRNLKVVV